MSSTKGAASRGSGRSQVSAARPIESAAPATRHRDGACDLKSATALAAPPAVACPASGWSAWIHWSASSATTPRDASAGCCERRRAIKTTSEGASSADGCSRMGPCATQRRTPSTPSKASDSPTTPTPTHGAHCHAPRAVACLDQRARRTHHTEASPATQSRACASHRLGPAPAAHITSAPTAAGALSHAAATHPRSRGGRAVGVWVKRRSGRRSRARTGRARGAFGQLTPRSHRRSPPPRLGGRRRTSLSAAPHSRRAGPLG